jgi:hypothetical protein
VGHIESSEDDDEQHTALAKVDIKPDVKPTRNAERMSNLSMTGAILNESLECVQKCDEESQTIIQTTHDSECSTDVLATVSKGWV